jgi:hypothetical protein
LAIVSWDAELKGKWKRWGSRGACSIDNTIYEQAAADAEHNNILKELTLTNRSNRGYI